MAYVYYTSIKRNTFFTFNIIKSPKFISTYLRDSDMGFPYDIRAKQAYKIARLLHELNNKSSLETRINLQRKVL